jgi:micrococcal nuclease
LTRAVTALLAVALGGLAGCGSSGVKDAGVPGDRWREELQRLVVVQHVDGDTVRVELDESGPAGAAGEELAVRLLGIDTPESGGPYRDEECFGKQAARRLAELVPVGSVGYGETDRELRDDYDRTLLYLYVDNDGAPQMVNLRMVGEGYAESLLVAPNDRHIDRIRAAERQAEEQSLGLWGAC